MTRECICCKQQVDELVSDISFFGFPRDKELKKKWLAAINKKFCGSLRICSRHFKEEDFRHSVIGNKRYLKKGVIPSLYLNEKSKNDEFFNSQDATTKENQLIGTVNKCTMETNETKSASNDQLSHITGRDVKASIGDEHTNTQFISQECYSEPTVPETILPSPSSSNEPVKKRKRCLYDIQWEEVSSSPVQAKIYWEVVTGKIMRQKEILKSLRPKVKRLQRKIQELQSQIKSSNFNK